MLPFMIFEVKLHPMKNWRLYDVKVLIRSDFKHKSDLL